MINSLKFLVCFVAVGAIISLVNISVCAADTNSRIERLERDVETLSRAVYSGDSKNKPSVSASGSRISNSDMAGYEIRVSQMEIELRNLTGKLEQQEFLIRRLQEKVDKVIGDLEIRVGELEKKINGGKNNLESSKSNITAKNIEPENAKSVYTDTVSKLERVEMVNPDAPYSPSSDDISSGGMKLNGITGTGKADASSVYEYAFDLLKKGDYEEAEKEFKRFMKDFPENNLIPNAQYWLGETYYVRGNFERAARTFAEGYKKYPKSSKAPDNLLKLGLSLAGMDNVKDACITLQQIEKKFNNGASSILNRVDREMERLNCGNM